jgi:hypothetical protein
MVSIQSFNILKATFLIFFLSSCVTLGADQRLVNLGRWSDPELSQIITTARQIDTPGERIVALSGHFMETPYAAATLVGGPQTEEQLVINLAEFDCFTFLDVIEALRRSSDLADFPEQLRQVRYRGGQVTYADRRHFFSDWVAGDSDWVGDVTAAVGQGRSQTAVKQLNLKSDGAHWLPGIPVTQRDVTYISTNNIDRKVLSALQVGDYVGIYSDRAGLDVSHTGLLVQGTAALMLRHASSRSGVRRVVDDDLLEYLKGKPGLVVYRAR